MTARVQDQVEQEPFDTFVGERKFVTVMFVDIAQSGRLVAGRDPEEADDCLLPVLQVMIEAVQRFGGTVNQVMGDGLMAIFRRAHHPGKPWTSCLPGRRRYLPEG